MIKRKPALVVLEDGSVFQGSSYGAEGKALGEFVFATGMTGYQETLTDPSYHKQVIVMTAPHIGNTGVNAADAESDKVWAAGIVIRDAAIRASNFRSEGELEDLLVEQGTVGICDVDTRALTRRLRDHGVMRGGIFSGSVVPIGAFEGNESAINVLKAIVVDQPRMSGANLAGEVSTTEAYVVEPTIEVDGEPLTVVAVDLGIKARTPAQLASRGVRVIVVPQSVTISEILAYEPDGVFFSNGPGDPEAATEEITLLREVLDHKLPFFGICFGNQLLGRALGYGTYKLEHGHRGVNQPILERATGTVQITAHNHGFAVDVPVDEPSEAPFGEGRYGRVEVTHLGLNDGVVEGIAALDLPAFSVQYHPEAAAGPHDGEYEFDRFIEMMKAKKEAANAPQN